MLCPGTEISPQRGKRDTEPSAEARSRALRHEARSRERRHGEDSGDTEQLRRHGAIAEAQPLTPFGLFVALLSVAALEVISKRPMAPQGC